MFNVFASLAIDRGPFSRDLRAAKDEATRFVGDVERSTGRVGGVFGKIGAALGSVFTGGKRESSSFFASAEREAGRLQSTFRSLGGAASSIFQGVGQGVGQAIFTKLGQGANAFKGALVGLNTEWENASARINAFTKDAGKTAELMEMVKQRAASTPFALQDMSNALGSLLPVARSSGKGIEDLLKQAEILAASNPMEGLEGASFSLREAMTGDFTSIIERFNLSRSSINKWKEEGVSNFEIVQRAMAEMGYDAGLVTAMGATMQGRWSTLTDTMQGFARTLTSPMFDVLKDGLVFVQGALDANTPRITAMAAALGTDLARGTRLALDGVITFAQAISGDWVDSDKISSPVVRAVGRIGTDIGSLTRKLLDLKAGFTGAFGDSMTVGWVSAGAEARSVLDNIKGGFDQIAEVIRSGDFTGGGPFAEDSPLIAGIFSLRNGVNEASDAFDRLREKAGIPMPKLPDAPKLPGGGLSGGEIGVAGAALGGVGLAAAGGLGAIALAAAPLAPILGPVIGIVTGLAGALGGLLVPLGLAAAGAAALYIAWDQNLGGIQEKTAAVRSAVTDELNGLRGGAEQAANGLADGLQAGLGRFTSWYETNLAPSLRGLGTAIQEGLANAAPGVQKLGDTFTRLGAAVMPVLQEVGGYLLSKVGPAIEEVVSFATANIPRMGQAFTNVVGVITPVLNGLASFITKNQDTIVSILTGALDLITSGVRTGWTLISGIWQTALQLLTGDWSGAWTTIKDTGTRIFGEIQSGLETASNVLKDT
ncbi:MAG TPA: hypothetical protein VIL69_00680, partial [Roseomonas sp.]